MEIDDPALAKYKEQIEKDTGEPGLSIVIIAVTCLIAIAVIAFILGVRPKDLPEPEPVSPFQHLDERKAAIYENLRDLQFEYRVGKLSDHDYQTDQARPAKGTRRRAGRSGPAEAQLQRHGARPRRPPPANGAEGRRGRRLRLTCPHCGASFDKALKFCGECGKPMKRWRSMRDACFRCSPIALRRSLRFAAVTGTSSIGPPASRRPAPPSRSTSSAADRHRADRPGQDRRAGQVHHQSGRPQGPHLIRTAFDGVTYNHMLPPGLADHRSDHRRLQRFEAARRRQGRPST